MDFMTVAQSLIEWSVSIGKSVHDLPGSVAFGLGLFTWFAVEQVLRRMMAGLRWIMVVAILGGLGLSVPYVTGLLVERGGAAEFQNSSDQG